MVDFVVNAFADVVDFFFTFWADEVINRFAKKKP